jgi:hypothetical protein
VTALLTTVTHLPVALLIALEHPLAADTGAVVALVGVVDPLPQPASSRAPLAAIARYNARLACDPTTAAPENAAFLRFNVNMIKLLI